MSPLVSLVTPVFNEEKYLAECIESVLAQTYQNWEYTILDNCSADLSASIAQRYAAKDARIRVIRNSAVLPVIKNHNAALRLISAQSVYCKVVFADDWIFPECLERMVGVAEAHPSIGIVSAYMLEGEHVSLTGLPYRTTVLSGREILRRHILDGLEVFGSANCLLYRADLIRNNDPFFNESNIHADTEACFAVLRSCDFGFVHQVLTFSRIRPGSLRTRSALVQSDFACMLHILKEYGSSFLTEAELEASVERHVAEYYAFLGKSVFLNKGTRFWEVHRRALRESGVGYSRGRVALAAAAAVLEAACNPKQTVEKLRRRRELSAETRMQ